MPDTMRQSPRDDDFAELVCADPDCVRAEFAAIVAADFPATADFPYPADRGAPPTPCAPGWRLPGERRSTPQLPRLEPSSGPGGSPTSSARTARAVLVFRVVMKKGR